MSSWTGPWDSLRTGDNSSQGFMLLKLGTCYFGMFGVGFLMSISFTRYPKDAY